MIVLRRTLRSRRKALIWWSVAIFGLVFVNVAAFPSIAAEDTLGDIIEGYPDFVQEILGLGSGLSFTEPAGYLNSQVFSNVLPLIFIIFLIGFAVRETAGDERAGTLDLVAAHPVTRRRLMTEKALAGLAATGGLTVVSILTLLIGAPMFEMGEIGFGQLVGATVSVVLVGVVFGGVAFAVGAATGSRALALGASSGLAVATFILFGLAPLIDAINSLERLSPFFWALTGDPVLNGVQAGNALGMLGVGIGLMAVGVWTFERRDLRV